MEDKFKNVLNDDEKITKVTTTNNVYSFKRTLPFIILTVIITILFGGLAIGLSYEGFPWIVSIILIVLFIIITIVFYSTCQQKLPPVAVPGSISRRGRITLVPANNAKVIARYCISRRNATIQINKFSLLVVMHPYWKIGDTIQLMLYQGTGGSSFSLTRC